MTTPNELDLLTKRLNAAFVSNPGATRQALVAAIPECINALAAIAVNTEYRESTRLRAIDILLGLQSRVVREDLQRATAAIKRREVECRAIEAQVAKIKAKVEQDVEARKKRAAIAKAGRILAAAKRVKGPDAA